MDSVVKAIHTPFYFGKYCLGKIAAPILINAASVHDVEECVANSVQFGNKEKVTDPKEFCDYHCMVNKTGR